MPGAALGQVRPQLDYKTRWRGTKLTVADRWFPSSKLHHGCGCRLAPLAEGDHLAKYLVCAKTLELVDEGVPREQCSHLLALRQRIRSRGCLRGRQIHG